MSPITDTIVAVSSPPGRSPRGIVRLSGPQTSSILHRLGVGAPQPHQVCRSRLCLQSEIRNPKSEIPLPCLLSFHPAPRSYTGDDTAEIQLPGHPALLERLIHRAVRLGARLAEPGEFTFRAFLNGKLDLTQAEGIAATIAARSDGQLRAAAKLRRGDLGSFAASVVDQLATLLALVEAGIDFTDQDDVVAITPDRLWDGLEKILHRLTDMLAHSRSWGELTGLPAVVLVGPPSAGKSTLFNTLLGATRAVTSQTPGTTRDVLAEPLILNRPDGGAFEVMLTDVAGLDAPAAVLDQHIQQSAHQAIERADLILLIHEGPAPANLPVKLPPAAAVLRVGSKCDLHTPGDGDDAQDVRVSAHTGQGIDELKRAMVEKLAGRGVSVGGDMLALQPRHRLAVEQSGAAISEALAALAQQRNSPHLDRPELIAGTLRLALDQLESLGGRMTPDDVLGRVFATFCVGK